MSLVMTRCRAEIRTEHLDPDNEQMRYVLRHSRRFFFLMVAQPLYIKILLWTECKSSGVHEGYGDTNSFLGGVSAH